MQVTKEQIDNDIQLTEANLAQANANLEQAKAQVNMLTGALTVLKNISTYLGMDDPPPPVPEPEISEVNAKIQEAMENGYYDEYEVEEV